MASGRPSSLGAQALPGRLRLLDHSVAGWGSSPSPLRWEGQREARQAPGSQSLCRRGEGAPGPSTRAPRVPASRRRGLVTCRAEGSVGRGSFSPLGRLAGSRRCCSLRQSGSGTRMAGVLPRALPTWQRASPGPSGLSFPALAPPLEAGLSSNSAQLNLCEHSGASRLSSCPPLSHTVTSGPQEHRSTWELNKVGCPGPTPGD